MIEVEVVVADVVVAVAVVATTTPPCLEVAVPHRCAEEIHANAEALGSDPAVHRCLLAEIFLTSSMSMK